MRPESNDPEMNVEIRNYRIDGYIGGDKLTRLSADTSMENALACYLKDYVTVDFTEIRIKVEY